jgi:hypothetical protein
MNGSHFLNVLNKKNTTFVFIALMTILMMTTSISMIYNVQAHSGKLLNINGKDYWVWVDINHDGDVVDVLGGGDIYISEADPQDPLNQDSNKTIPVSGMEEILGFNVIANGKNKTFDLERVWNGTDYEAGHYEAHFIHTTAVPYEYELFGNWNGTQFSATWTCTPGVEPEYKQTNETTTLSEGVIQKADSGPFNCPKPLSEVSFPDISISNAEIQAKLNGSTTHTSDTINNGTGTG